MAKDVVTNERGDPVAVVYYPSTGEFALNQANAPRLKARGDANTRESCPPELLPQWDAWTQWMGRA